MKINKIASVAVAAGVLAAGHVVAAGDKSPDGKNLAVKTSEALVTTNDNGSVTRSFTECNVKTNGNMVTEHRRETRTTLDTHGNILESSTSEYAQSYAVGDEPGVVAKSRFAPQTAPVCMESFLGLKFGEEWKGTNFVETADETTLLAAQFTPAKPLELFDKYYVFVTPKTHRIAKVVACAAKAVEPGVRWRRHYLIEALEKKYGTWARLCSMTRPAYAFDVGGNGHIIACLADASTQWQTVLSAWDDDMMAIGAKEFGELRREARNAAREEREKRVEDAADAF